MRDVFSAPTRSKELRITDSSRAIEASQVKGVKAQLYPLACERKPKPRLLAQKVAEKLGF